MNIRKKPWSDREDRFISTHRRDGCILIAEGLKALGSERSCQAVRMHAKRRLGLKLGMYPDNGMRKCVVCGRWDARPNTHAGKAGYCPTCWKKRKAEAYAESVSELEAEKEYRRWVKHQKDLRKRQRRGEK